MHAAPPLWRSRHTEKPSSPYGCISKLMSSNTFGVKINPLNFPKEPAANKSTAEPVFIPSNSIDTIYWVKYPPEAQTSG